MPRFKLTVAYDGTNFHGWQKQTAPHPGCSPLRTVQGVLEEAVRSVVRLPEIDVVGASRTDAGVHAIGQVAAFTAKSSIPLDKLPLAINSRLPDDVQVRSAELVATDFNPIGGATSKAYRYSIAHGVQLAPLFDRQFVYWTWRRLDVEAMNAATKHLIGEHDFTSFAQASHGRESTVRTIFDCAATAIRAPGCAPDRCQIDVTGSGFLYNMVRIIAGTLVEVGRGKWPPERIREIVEAKDRRAAGPTLPPHGLCLMWIRYDRPGDSEPGW